MTENPSQVASHINPSAATALIGDPAKFGYVGEDGTVFVQTPYGDKAVGSYPGKSPEEALQYFVRKFEALASEVAHELYLAERRFVLTRFSGSDDIKGEVVKEALTESLIMQYKQNMEQLEPHNIFTLSTKITEL